MLEIDVTLKVLFFREGFEKGIRRAVDIITQGIDIWHVMEFDHYLLDEASHGQLHDGDTYVIRWHYVIAQTGFSILSPYTS